MARRRQRNGRDAAPADHAHYRRIRRPFDALRILSDDQVAHIHTEALRYLAEHGIRVLLPEAREIYAAHGAAVADDMVRLDPEMVASALATAPAEFTIETPNPDRHVTIGGSNVVLTPVGGPPFVSDIDRGRRDGTLADQENFLRLTQHFDVMHMTMPFVEPSDVPLAVRHLVSGRATLELSDKVPFVFARGRRRVADSLELIRIRHGLDSIDELAPTPRCWANINTNSPRQLDVPMSLGLIDFARAGQALIVTPFTLAGAMAPVTMAGALVLQHLEALAAITLTQLVRPGTPVIYGAFTSNVDMRSGSPAFGTPEAFTGAVASGQLARHVGLPWRSSGSSASNAVDAQGGVETMMNTWAALLGGANVIFHAAGWQEGGLVASYEKFIVDIEMCQMIAESCRPLTVDESTLALDAITEVGPGGHFFGAAHTMERYETAFYQPLVFSRSTFEQWSEQGCATAEQRANPIWKQVLADFEPPPMDDAVRAELDDFVARRTAEGGAAPD